MSTNTCSVQVLYTETVSNPTLVVADLEALSALAKTKVSTQSSMMPGRIPMT
jgi:cystathionine beta-lyase/cystathionine gamma-synthase